MTFLELMATLGINTDRYNEGLDNAESRASSAGSTIARGLGVAATAVGAAVGAAAVGVGRLTMASVEAYGEYEQLVGGVEKIFGESADAVSEYADIAYQTAGLSANEYMQTVTSFSASLLQGLDGDTEAAAEIANQAIIDMSDNANTYGTDMASIQNAYMGFAKDNYTMLDNLKLGYGGTREEMIRLINDSGILEEEIDSLDDVSFDQIILAIHEVQEQTNIAGTTANEAASTIQGSLSMLQGAWQNLVIGLGDSESDLTGLINNVVDAARTAVGNILPVATQALSGIAQLISEVAPMIAAELPGIIDEILPPLLSAAVEITSALVSALPSILSAITSVIPQLLSTLIPAILEMIPQLISAGAQLLMGLAQGLIENFDTIMDAVMDVVHIIVDQFLTPDNIVQMYQVAFELIFALMEGLLEHAPELVGAIVVLLGQMLDAYIEFQPIILQMTLEFLGKLTADAIAALWRFMGLSDDTILQGFEAIQSSVRDFGTNFIGLMQSTFDGAVSLIVDGLDYIVGSFSDKFNEAWDIVRDVFNGIFDTIGGVLDDIKGVVTDAVQYLIDAFNFNWSLPEIQLPHFNISGGEAPWGFAGQGSMPQVAVEWYAKAYDQPFILNDPTIFGYGNGKFLGGGEGTGGELIVGWDQLMSKISEAAQPVVHAHIYIGGTEIEDYVVDLNQKTDFIGGGRA